MFLVYTYIFVIGLCLGSFLNVVLFRLDRKSGILTGRSECQNCSTRLRWYDLVPLFSYLYLRGNCRYCKSEISMIYPVVELTAGIAVLSYFMLNGLVFNVTAVYFLLIIALSLLLIFFDALYLILPDKIIFTAVIFAFSFDLVFKRPELLNFVLSGFFFGLAFGIIYLVSHGQWMGFGDVKLVFAMGLILGYPLGFVAIVSAVWVAAIWGMILMALKKASLKTALPFGSFLSGATIVFIIFKDVIIEKIIAYQSFF